MMSNSAFLSFYCDIDQEETFNLLTNLMMLFAVPPNRQRYSVETLIVAFKWFHNSNGR